MQSCIVKHADPDVSMDRNVANLRVKQCHGTLMLFTCKLQGKVFQ